MPVTVVRREETLDQLITRTQGRLTAAQLTDVRVATLAANPHLADAGPLAPGAIVVVPPVRVTPADAPPETIANDVAKLLDAAVSEYRGELASRVDARRAELSELAKTLKSAPVRRAITQLPGGDELIAAIEGATKQSLSDVDDARDYLKTDIEALGVDLRKLSDKLPDYK
jgi:phage tail protein X